MVKLPDGSRVRVFGTPEINTKAAAEQAERDHIERVKAENRDPELAKRMEVPSYGGWFWGHDPEAEEPNGRFWNEWVIANKNKPSEQESKRLIYKAHLAPRFATLRLDEIDAEEIAGFRAALVKRELSEKSINNILAVLSKSLRWAEEVGVIASAPRIRFYKVERPEIEFYSFDEYARILRAAKLEGPLWYAAICLAGEAGLRVGEVKALRWREDVDLIAGTITIQQQVRRCEVGTPKGRTRRSIPMTATLHEALKELPVIREGYVLKNDDGIWIADTVAKMQMYRICRRAGLPERGWHIMRHTFGTHAAMFGVNPWSLMSWMGHKRIEETMGYVHVAQNRRRELPAEILAAGEAHRDPDLRINAMLGARAQVEVRGTVVAQELPPIRKRQKLQLVA
jgi:integrase